MADPTSVTKEVLTRLGAHLRLGMPTLQEVTYGFPEANAQLKFPSLTIVTSRGTNFRAFPPYVDRQGSTAGVNGDVYYCVGEYDWKLQLDFWTPYKEQRHALYERFFQAFHSQMPILGLSLQLAGYHNAWCRYDLTDFEIADSEDQSQRKEWRLKVGVIAECKALMLRSEYLIKHGETQFDTQQNEGLESRADF